MNHPGFRLVALRLTGKEVEDAEVLFEKGLNVICGPSDTGKTFILQCIDFALGGKNRPKEIPEASTYDTIHLQIASYSEGKSISLRRSLQGGAIEVIPEGEESFTLKAQHRKESQETLSYYLLKLSGLEDKWLKKNKSGTKQSLSFRNIVHLSLVTEENVIKEISPILTGHRTSQTAELSAFRLLLTGVDDSSVFEKEDKIISKIRVESKNEVLQSLIDQAREAYKELDVVGSYEELQDQLEKLEQSYGRTSEALDAAHKSISEMEDSRLHYWEKLRQTESRLNVLSELGSRFNVLEKQYESDIRRLDAITETGSRLTEMNLDRCTVCGSLAEHHESEYQDALINPEIVSKSCVAEAVKLQTLLTDLKNTQADVEAERVEKRELKGTLEFMLEMTTNAIQNNLKPKLKQILSEYRVSQQKKESVNKAIELLGHLKNLEGLIEGIAAKESSEGQKSEDSVLPAKGIEEFSLEVEDRLKAWNFPNTGRVTFSESDWDVIISGRRRASHGKGVRAITHAAFSLGLLAYCRRKRMPHPNFLMIDSPLVVYREPDSDDKSMSLDVKDSFYKDIASSFSDVQVIILENEDPPQQLIDSNGFNLIAFSKTNDGRYGFIPVAADKTN